MFNKHIKTDTNDNYYKHILYDNHKIFHFEEEIVEQIDLTVVWSATSFKTYLQCKRKFYIQYLLKIKEHSISLKPKAYELGDIIHSILEDYYTIDENSKDELPIRPPPRMNRHNHNTDTIYSGNRPVLPRIPYIFIRCSTIS